jgi:hypothetical protein
MNDDQPVAALDQLVADHRALDEQIRTIAVTGQGDQLELARLKKRKLMLKDRIAQLRDLAVPDIIA